MMSQQMMSQLFNTLVSVRGKHWKQSKYVVSRCLVNNVIRYGEIFFFCYWWNNYQDMLRGDKKGLEQCCYYSVCKIRGK